MIGGKFITGLFPPTDEQAMKLVQADGDAGAFAVLVERWRGPIERLGTRMTGDAHRAQDVAQETFARVFARRMQYQAGGRFSTWLWRVALNACYDELRRRKARRESFADGDGPEIVLLDAVAPEPSPSQAIEFNERGAMVRRALQALPEIYRTVLVLRHYEDLKFREIADVLGVPEGTVKSRMVEALAQMESLLREAEKPAREQEQHVL